MIQGIERYLPILKDSIFKFLDDQQRDAIISNATVFSCDRGLRVPREEQPLFLYVLLDGDVQIRIKGGVDIGRSRPGRSFELRALLLNEKTWSYDWICESKAMLLKVPWTDFVKALSSHQQVMNYLIRITSSVPLQRLKRDLNGLGLSRNAVIEIISKMHYDPVENIFKDWNRKVFFTLAFGEVLATVRFNDRKYKVTYLQSGDTSFFNLKTSTLSYEAADESKAWVLFENEWLKLDCKSEFLSFLDVFEYHSRNVMSVKNAEHTDYIDLKRNESLNQTSKKQIQATSVSRGSYFQWLLLSLFRPHAYASRDECRTTSSLLVTFAKYYGVTMGQQRVERKIQELASSQALEGIEKAAKLVGFKSKIVEIKGLPSDKSYWPCVVMLESGAKILFARSDSQVLLGDPDSGEVVNLPREKVENRIVDDRVLVLKKTEALRERKDPGVPIENYFRILFAEPYLISLYVIAGFIAFFFDLALPVLNQYLFDVVISEKNIKLFLPSIAAILVCTLCSNFLMSFNQRLAIDLSSGFTARLKSLFQNRLFRLPLRNVRSLGMSSLLTRYIDMDQIGGFFVNGVLCSVLGVFLMFGSLSVLWMYHPKLVYLTIIFIPIEMILVKILRHRLEDNRMELAQLKARENRMIVEHFTASDDMKTLKGLLTARWRWELAADKSASNMKKSGKLNAIFQLFHFLFGELVKIVCFLAAVRFYLKGEMSLGQVVGTSLLVPKVSQPVQALVASYFQYFSIRPIMQRLNDIIYAPVELNNLKNSKLAKIEEVPKLTGSIAFKNVSFNYDLNSDRIALSNINFTIQAQEKIAIVGPSGCGKSSIASLLNGLYEPTDGEIMIDGKNINDLSLELLREQIFVVEQEGDLFAGTIQENIALGDPTPNVDRVQMAAKLSELEEEILAKPGGFSSPLQHGGAGVSEGQKQRLLIARAIYKNPSVLVMDEATSHLDPIAEERVLEHVFDYFKQKTIIFFTQRVHLTMKCDRVFYVENGKVVEAGSHKDLIAKQGKYYQFFIMHLSLG